MPDTSIRTYTSKRNFAITAEPVPSAAASTAGMPRFVVQKHAARRAGLHYDFRLEHGGVLWSWAVPRGPSLDPKDRRMAIHVEDHPLDYASFQGAIPEGEYGAGTVETWDTGTWETLYDADFGMGKGHLHFILHGGRLKGRFSLVRSHRRDPRKQEAWFLLKHEDEFARPGIGAPELEAEPVAPVAKPRKAAARKTSAAPAPGAVRGALPGEQAPELCALSGKAPEGDAWVSEIKFDGYRILASIEGDQVRLLTRNGLDWAARMPSLAARFKGLGVQKALLDGELVALREDGVSSFPALQAALKAGRDDQLVYYAFDLLHLDGWDLRPCTLLDRKAALQAAVPWSDNVRYSEHVVGAAAEMHANAGRMGLEGIVCKRADSPYRAGRGGGWVKVKCLAREELVVLGWTPPAGSREGFGALHVGYYDAAGQLHYAGGVGTGFDGRDLAAIRARLDGMGAPPPAMLVSGDPVDPAVNWVRPELVIETQFTGWSGAGRVRHAVFLGIREDKAAAEVVRDVADPEAARVGFVARRGAAKRGWHGAVPPLAKVGGPKVGGPRVAHAAQPAKIAPATRSRIVTAKAPQKPKTLIGHVELTHPERELWPGISKRDLATYWESVAPFALKGLAHRPLSILRCPEGIAGETFFQKNGHGHLPAAIREGRSGTQPFLAIDDLDGLYAMTQMSAIELHPWGAPEADPTRPDHLVFDLDPGDAVPFPRVVAAALEVRERLTRLGLQSFCRTTGGKGLHVVVPLVPGAGWDRAKPFCRAFAETMAQDMPDQYVAHLKIADRAGKILVDWLRNGLGATAVASFCPRARAGAGVATPLAWSEVTAKLDPGAFTVTSVPARLARLKRDPWEGYDTVEQRLPEFTAPEAAPEAKPRSTARIVTARKPKPRA